MGNCMSKKEKRKVVLVVLGLDNAGKTSVIKGITGEALADVAPTVGFGWTSYETKDLDVTLYDLGGGARIRDIWKNYFPEVFGIVFLVDASDLNRLDEVKNSLKFLVEHPQIREKPMLLLLNKQDCHGALDEIDATDRLNLSQLVNKNRSPCRVETCVATRGTGRHLDSSIRAGFLWLLEHVSQRYDELLGRITKDVQDAKVQLDLERQIRRKRVEEAKKQREIEEDEEGEQNQGMEAANGAIRASSRDDGRPQKHRQLPFRPLPEITEEGALPADSDSSLSQALPNGKIGAVLTSLAESGTSVPRLPPISPQPLRKLPEERTLTPLSPTSKYSNGFPYDSARFQRRLSSDAEGQRLSDVTQQNTARKRKRKRLERFNKTTPFVGASDSEDSSRSQQIPEALASLPSSEPRPPSPQFRFTATTNPDCSASVL